MQHQNELTKIGIYKYTSTIYFFVNLPPLPSKVKLPTLCAALLSLNGKSLSLCAVENRMGKIKIYTEIQFYQTALLRKTTT